MAVHNETKRQRQAFEFYYSLGASRNQEKVARRFGVTRWTVSQWSRWYDWAGRMKQRNKEVAEATGKMPGVNRADPRYYDLTGKKKIIPDDPVIQVAGKEVHLSELTHVDNQVDKDIDKIDPEDKLAIKKAYREIVALALQTYKEKLLSSKVKVNIGDIERLMKLDFALMGDNMDRLDINIKTDKATVEFEEKEGIMSEEDKDKFYKIVARYAREERNKD